MTENEYKRLMEIVFDDCVITKEDADAITTIFEEIQQYRTIGTIEEFKALKEKFDERLYEHLIYSKVKEDSYNKAIDEFVKKLKKRYPIMENDLFTINDVLHTEIDRIAEQMKKSS